MADLGNTISLNASKFAAGVAQTRAKLTELNTAFVENRNKMKELNTEAKKLQKQEQDLAKEMKNGGTAEQREQLQQLQDRIAQVNSQIGVLRTRESELRHDISQTNRELQEQRNSASNLAESFSQLGQMFAGLGIAETCHQIANAFDECVKKASDFEATISTVQALSSASDSEMELLSAKAKNLGATTKFTASEAAQAMVFMGMAGWDAQQMLDGMSGMLDLAAASGSDLGTVADIVTDNLTAFGMKAEDTAHFADVLAAAATNSNTSVEIMGETFKNSAAVAGALGYSVEDVSTAVGLMANAGIKGTIAGTALKNTFNGLLDGATLTSAAFGEVEISAVNADGTMKDFGETVNELRGYFSQMTEAERVMNAKDIAGAYGYNGLLAIVNSTQQDFDKLTDSINECEGAASRMAEVKMDNLQGQVTLMNSAMDALKNTLGSAYDDELRELAKAATDVLTAINEFLEKHPTVTKAIVGITAAITGLVSAFATFATVSAAVNMVKKFAAASDLAAVSQKGLTVAMKAAPYAALAAAIGLVVAEMKYYADAAFGVSEEVKELQDAQKKINDSIDDGIAANEAEMKALQDKANRYEELRNVESRTNAQELELKTLAEELQSIFGDDVQVINSLTGEYNELTDAVDHYIEAQKREAKMSVYKDAVKEIYQQIEEAEKQLQNRAEKHSEAMNSFNPLDWNHGAETSSFLNDQQATRDLIADYERQIDELAGKMSGLYEEAADSAENFSGAANKAAESAEGLSYKINTAGLSAEEMQKSLDDLSKSSSDLVSEYGKLFESLDKLQNGESLSYAQVQALIAVYPELAKHIQVTANGYTVEADALTGLNDALLDGANAQVEAENEKTRAAIEGAKERIRLYQKEAEAAAMYEHDNEKVRAIGRKIGEEQDYIDQLEANLAVNKSLPDYLQSNRGNSSASSKGGTTANSAKEKEPPGLKSLMGYAKTTSAAFKEMQDNGELALSTVQALIDAGYDEKVVYQDAAGKWVINTDEYLKAANAQIDAAKQVEGATAVQKNALESFRGELGKVTEGIYDVTTAEKELADLNKTESSMQTLSDAFAEQKTNGSISDKTARNLLSGGYGAAVMQNGDGTFSLDQGKVTSELQGSIQSTIAALNEKKEAAKTDDERAEIEAEIAMWEKLSASVKDVTGGIYEAKEAQKELLSLRDMSGNMRTLSEAFAEQKENGGLSADTIAELSGTQYAKALTVGVDGKVTLDSEKLKAELSEELDSAIKDLEEQLKTAEEGDIPALQAQIQAFKDLKSTIGEVTEGLYGVEKAQEKIVSDEALKATEDAANKRLKQIDAELKAKQKLRDETLKAIDDEVQARQRLTEDNDIQRQIDQVSAQLKYSQLDEFSRAQLERKMQSLQSDKADMLWERGVEDRRAAANDEYDTAAEELNAEKEAINNSLEVLRTLNDTVATGIVDLEETIKAAMEAVKSDSTFNLTINNADKMTTEQLYALIEEHYGSTGAV